MERSTFVGSRIPKEVKLLPQLLNDVDKRLFKSVVLTILASIEGTEPPRNPREEFAHENEELAVDTLLSGLYFLITRALRIPSSAIKQENFVEDLKELKIPPQFIPDLTKLLCGSRRTNLDENILTLTPHHSKLKSMQWRIDVSISTSVLTRALQPSIFITITLDSGRIYVFEVPIAKFHVLRCSVATALKDMEDLERRNIFRIQD